MDYQLYRIKSFRVVSPYTIEVLFNDDTKKVINFLPILRGEMYGPLADLSYFQKVTIDKEVHTLVWPNGADFDPDVLYNWDEYLEELTERAKGW